VALIKIATRAQSHQEILKKVSLTKFRKKNIENQFLHSILTAASRNVRRMMEPVRQSVKLMPDRCRAGMEYEISQDENLDTKNKKLNGNTIETSSLVRGLEGCFFIYEFNSF